MPWPWATVTTCECSSYRAGSGPALMLGRHGGAEGVGSAAGAVSHRIPMTASLNCHDVRPLVPTGQLTLLSASMPELGGPVRFRRPS